MQLPEGVRQIVAGVLASGVFLALFLGGALVWWVALGLGAVAYFAFLLIIRRRLPSSEVMLGDRVSKADLDAAAASLASAGARLRAASQAAPAADRDEMADMADHVLSIRELILADPNDYRLARPFITFYLPKIVEMVESYVALARQARGAQSARLADLGQRIRGFAPIVRKIEKACLDNDLAALEAEVEALGFQVKRIAGVAS
jgi:ribosome-binding protein aMBF1 (putative translation factor)